MLDSDLHDHDPAVLVEFDTLDHNESRQVEQNRSSVIHARGPSTGCLNTSQSVRVTSPSTSTPRPHLEPRRALIIALLTAPHTAVEIISTNLHP